MGTNTFLHGSGTRYRTLTPMLVVRVPGAQGGETYVTGRGRFLPAAADPDHIDRLLELGLIEEAGTD